VHDLQGRHVATLVSGLEEAGERIALWDGRDADGRRLAAGVYVIRLETDDGSQTRSLVRVD
jgi:flagellar hook assembly protein FlgD